MSLHFGLGEDTLVNKSSDKQRTLPVGVTGEPTDRQVPSIYQTVQETAVGPKFLTSWDTQEAAMRDCRELNICSGNPFKTVLWGAGTPCLRCSPEQTEFKRDNKLPSFIKHTGAVTNYPEALPVSAVYNHGAEVIFLPDGTGTDTALASFSFGDVETPWMFGQLLDYDSALCGAKERAKKTGRPAIVKAHVNSRKGRRTMPATIVRAGMMGVRGLNGLGSVDMNPIISPVTPAEFQRLIEMSQQYTG